MLRTITIGALFVLACGGGQKAASPAPDDPGGGDEEIAPAEGGDCCCDFIQESGDPAGDDWSENQVYELMTDAQCDDVGGQCGDESACGSVEE